MSNSLTLAQALEAINSVKKNVALVKKSGDQLIQYEILTGAESVTLSGGSNVAAKIASIDATIAIKADSSNIYSKQEVDSKLSSVYRYKGTLNTYADLPATDQSTGDTYNIVTADTNHLVKAGDNIAWTGEIWDNLGGTIDLSGKVDVVDGKQLSTNDYTNSDKQKVTAFDQPVSAEEKATWNIKTQVEIVSTQEELNALPDGAFALLSITEQA